MPATSFIRRIQFLILVAATTLPAQEPHTRPAARALTDASASFKAGLAAFERNNLPAAHKAFANVVRLAPLVAAGHSAYGAVLLAEGTPQAALPELELAHRLDPNDRSALLNLAIATSRLNNNSQAITLFQQFTPAPDLLTPEAVIAYASSLSATGQSEAADRQLRQALDHAPNNPTLHDSVGVLLAQRQRYPEADQQFHQPLAADASLAQAHFHLGASLLNQHNPIAAIPELQTAARLNPAEPTYALHLAQALTATSRDEEALKVLQTAQTQIPTSLDLTYALALALQSSGDTRQSLTLLQQVATARPTDPATLTNLGLAYIQTGDAKDSIAAYQQALQLTDNPTLRENLGAAYLQQSDLDHSIDQFHLGLKLDPANPQLHYDLGLAWKLKDDLPKAIPEFLAAEQSDPNLPDPPYTLGVLYMQQGRFPEAATQLERATTLCPENGPAWEILGNVYKQSDQPEKAAAALRRAITLLPDQPSPHISLATLLAQSGDNPGAAAERKIAATLSRTAVKRQQANFALDSGRLLLKRNQLPEALTQMQAAVAADPTYPEAHRALAEALDRQGHKAEAAKERTEATRLEALSRQ